MVVYILKTDLDAATTSATWYKQVPKHFFFCDQPHGLVVGIMRSRVRFPALPWEFSLMRRISAVTMVWVVWLNLGLRALLTLHPPISPLISSGQRNRASWASRPQKSVTLLPCPGGRTTKSTRTYGGNGPEKNFAFFCCNRYSSIAGTAMW